MAFCCKEPGGQIEGGQIEEQQTQTRTIRCHLGGEMVLPWVHQFREFQEDHGVPADPEPQHLLSHQGNHARPEGGEEEEAGRRRG